MLSHIATMNARLFVAIFDNGKIRNVDNSAMKPMIRLIRDAQGKTGQQLADGVGLSRILHNRNRVGH